MGGSGVILVDSLFADRYQLLRILGSGGMAEVYLARDRRLDRDVALKVLPHRYACDSESVERFRREAGAAARLNHPNIVQVYDWGEAAGTYYISMEYVSGCSLKEVIRKEEPLAPERIIAISTQVLDAVAVMHAAGFIHRDIKPQNILIDERGRAKVADLGIARAADTGGITVKGTILGTAQYLSPEQAQGKTAIPASDLYSVGAVMYEMATGRPPFTGENPVAIAMQHVSDEPAPPKELRPELSAGIEEVILRALAKSPQDRWASAQAFAGALESVALASPSSANGVVVSQEPVSAVAVHSNSSPSVIEKTQMRPGRSSSVSSEEKPEGDAGVGRSRRRVLIWSLVAVLCLLLAGGGVYGAVSLFRAEPVVVPGLVGRTMTEAETAAEVIGLKLEIGGPSENSPEYAEGRIIRQQPQEGAASAEGRAVYIWLSAGPEMVSVPNVNTLTQQEAIDAIRASELEVTVIKQETPDETPGEVYTQHPRAGEEVEIGSVVEITVAVAPPTTTTTSTSTTTTTTTTTTPPTTEDSGSGWWPWNWWKSDSDESPEMTRPARPDSDTSF